MKRPILKDKWLGSEALEVKISWFFSITKDKVANLTQVSYWNNNKWLWKVERRRTLFEWEVREANQLMNLLSDKSLTKDSQGHWVWKADENLVYTVSSTYRCLMTEVEGDFRFLWVLLEHQGFTIINDHCIRDPCFLQMQSSL